MQEDEAVLETNYAVAPEGHTTLHLKAGTKVTGKVARMAMKAGVAKRKPGKRGPKPQVAKTPTPDHEG